MHFNNLTALANHLSTVALNSYKQQLYVALEEIGEGVEKKAHEEIGIYQGSIGQFPAWAPLAESTLEKKERYGWGKGGVADTPLYATGDLDRSIGHSTMPNQLSVEIGTDEEKMAALEYGSAAHNLPPRPVLGPAALRVLPQFLPRVQHLAAAGLNCQGGFAVILNRP